MLFRSIETDAIAQTVLVSMREGFQNPLQRTLAGRFADLVLRGSLFNRVERINRIVAANTTVHLLNRTLTQAVAGRLRGNTLDIARRRMASIGIDLDMFVTQARRLPGTPGEKAAQLLTANGNQLYKDAILRGVRVSQFLPDVTRRPVLWNHPGWKLAFQFKTFALQHARFLRDHVLKEAGEGNPLPLAYILGL